MKKFFTSLIGGLRLISFIEGLSLVVLVFVGVPMKYFFNDPGLVKSIGPLHGVLFLVFVVVTIAVAVLHKWSFWRTTWKVLISSLVPFGMLYVDAYILRDLHNEELHTQKQD